MPSTAAGITYALAELYRDMFANKSGGRMSQRYKATYGVWSAYALVF